MSDINKEISDIFNELPNTLYPCSLCEIDHNLRLKYTKDGCLECCYYYTSHFVLKATKEELAE